jgi:hypothetical protein
MASAGHAPQADQMAASMPVPINITTSFIFVFRVIMIFSFPCFEVRLFSRVCGA